MTLRNIALLRHLTLIQVRGNDAITFLHGQLSADIEGLEDSGVTFACLCHPKGRVIALLLVRRTATGAEVICASKLAEKVSGWLQQFVFRDDVDISIDSGQNIIAADKPSESTVSPISGLNYDITTDEAVAPDSGAFKARELSMGVAWLDETSSEAFLPQMLGAEAIGALSYQKGCYPGQEIVARTHFLGKLKQRPVTARITEQIEAEPMSVCTLSNEGTEVKALMVDSAVDGNGTTQLFMVARAAKAVKVNRLKLDEHICLLDQVLWPGSNQV